MQKLKNFLQCQRIVVGTLLASLSFVGIQSIGQLKWMNIERPPVSYLGEYQPILFKWFASGYWPVAVDAIWLETLSLVGSGKYPFESKRAAQSFYRIANELDPAFFELYEQGGVLFSFYFEDPKIAIEILERGKAAYRTGKMPEDFWKRPAILWIYDAYVKAFLMEDWVGAKRSFLEGADVPGAPKYLQTMKLWLEKDGSERKLAVRVLKHLSEIEKDEMIRARYLEKLKKYE